MKQFIPAKLDIEKLLIEKPPHYIERFKRDNLIHIIHLISSIPATNKDLDIIDGFVPIYSPILQKKIRNYKYYIEYLLENNVIVTDNWYIKGQKSIGYKFTYRFSQGIKMIEVATAFPFNRSQKNTLVKKLKQITNAREIRLVIEVDSSLIGGFLIKTKSKTVDFTIKNQLQSLAKHLDTVLDI